MHLSDISAYPELTIDLRLDDRFVDLASEGIDLAFRIGKADAVSVKTRKLGEMRSYLVASPDYVVQHGTPERPEDLTRHACIVDTNRRNPRRWVLVGPERQEAITVAGQFFLNSARCACELAVEGKGIGFLPRFAVSDDLEAGRLVTLLDGYAQEANPISAVYLEGRRLPRKIRALIDFAVSDIRSANIL